MNLFVKDLPPDTQILIAMGAAVAAGCQTCLQRLVGLARDEALESSRMRAAITIGQFVKDQPAQEMKTLAHELLGEDPASRSADIQCMCDTPETAAAGCCG